MPDSDATTVPASAEEVKKFKSGIAHHVQKTPTPRGKVVENKSSEPKIKKQIQSKRILEEDEGKNEKKPARTAVKAKPQPRQQPDQVAKAEVGSETPRTAKAVQECLKRASTADILHKTPKTGSTTTPSTAPRHGSDEPCSPESQNSRAESDEESADEEEWAKKAAQARAKREAHARFMRFSRSLKSKRSPVEIRRAGRAAHRDSSKLQLLLEQWTQCDGVWAESDFVIECRRKTRHRQYGARVWLTRSELITKYQSVAVADSIIEAKEQDEVASREQIR
ncbi:unnamed protein product, partial [Durusdinium trenchii]